MAYIGKQPTAVPLTSSDLEDNIVTSAKIIDGTIALADLSATGTKDATTFLRGDNTFAEAGGGKVLQVVSSTASGTCSTTSDTFTDATNCPSLNITPSATTSKIFLIANIGSIENSGGTGIFTIFRDSTNLGDSDYGFGYLQPDGASYIGGGANFLDSPSTTSSINYEIRIRNSNSGQSFEISRTSTKATLTAFEIGV